MSDEPELPGTEGQETRKLLNVSATTLASAQEIAAGIIKMATIFAPPGVSIEEALEPITILVSVAVRNQLMALNHLAARLDMEDVVRVVEAPALTPAAPVADNADPLAPGEGMR